MAITTDTVALRLAQRLVAHGVEIDDVEAFAGDFAPDLVEWLGGEGAVPAALATKVTTTAAAWNTDVMERIEWWTGTVNGGPNSDGLYPMTNAAGVTTMFPSLAKILSSTAKGDSAYEVAVSLGYAGTEEEYAEGPVVAADYAQAKGDYALAKAIAADTAATAANLARDAAMFKAFHDTLAHLNANLAPSAGQLGAVYADATLANNGTYVKSGATGVGSWTKLVAASALGLQQLPAESGFSWAIIDSLGRVGFAIKLDGTLILPKLAVGSIPSAALADGSVGTSAIGALAVTLSRLAADVTGLMAMPLPAESGYSFAIVDSLRRAAFMISLDGQVTIPKLILGAGTVRLSNLTPEITGLMAQYLPPETGYVWAITDSLNRIGLGLRLDGTIVGGFTLTDGAIHTVHIADAAVTLAKLADASISEAKLDAYLKRQAVPHVTDVVAVEPDDWRGRMGRCANRTDLTGYGWSAFPRLLSRAMQGFNDTGQSLDFRRRAALLIRGRRYVNTFNPASASLESKVQRGVFVTATSWPPSGSFAAGDYYEYGDAATRTIGSEVYARGDLAVWNGSAWARQARPASASGIMGDWWLISTAGWWKGLQLAVGDFLFLHGGRAQGGPVYYEWGKGAPANGEFFLRGELDPASGLPASPVDGLAYSISVAGTAGGMTFAVGDYLVRDEGAWGRVQVEAPVTVPAGEYVMLSCRRDTAEWEMRRTDKSASRVGLSLKARVQTAPRRAVNDILVVGDSMPNLLATALSAAFADRTATTESYGGGSFADVVAMVQRNIRELGDPHRGKPTIVWAGQNGYTDFIHNEEQALRLMGLLGARDTRFLFMMILGQRIATFNGTRLVFDHFENQQSNVVSSPHVKLREFYKQVIPEQWFDTRLALVAQAGATPDLQFPGMTELQVATAYGIPPLSAWLNYASVGIVPASMTFQGYRTADGLPTGGVNNDYYLRSAGVPAITDADSVGNIIAKIAGTWTELAFDKTHFNSSTMQTAVANAIKTVFVSKGW